MKFSSIGSGSKGNGTVVQYNATTLLIDCGFSALEATSRLEKLGVPADSLSAILVTHEHGDHAKGVSALAKKYNIPVYLTFGTHSALKKLEAEEINIITPGKIFEIAGLSILPVTVPHDAAEPCQFVVSNKEGARLGILSDCGHVTPHMVACYHDLHALMLECNHDVELLNDGAYPTSLKRRVAGQYGHLNNIQAAEFLQAVQVSSLTQVVITHLSENNNHPEKALLALNGCKHADIVLKLADQSSGLTWHSIEI